MVGSAVLLVALQLMSVQSTFNHVYPLRVAVSETWLLLFTVPVFCPLAKAWCKKSAFSLSKWLV